MHPLYSYTAGIIFLSIYIASFYAYNKTDRKSFLAISLAWISIAIYYLFISKHMFIVAISVFSGLIWISSLELLKEDLIEIPQERGLKYFFLIPIAVVLYKPEMVAILVSSVVLLLSGAILYMKGSKRLKPLGLSKMFLGFVVLLKAFEATYGDILLIISFLTLTMFEFDHLLNTAYFGDIEVAGKEVILNEGINITRIFPKELEDAALVFSRDRKNKPNWFWISKLDEKGVIHPTNLPKMLDIAIKYMKKAKEENKQGLIIIDGVEYLIVENGFKAFLKFLSHLRDHAVLNSTVIYLVTDLNSLNEKERAALMRVLG